MFAGRGAEDQAVRRTSGGARGVGSRGRRARWMTLSLLTMASLLLRAPAVQACAVCFGKSDDPMVRGAAAGVIFLAIVVYGVLFSFAGIAGLFFLKARRLSRRG